MSVPGSLRALRDAGWAGVGDASHPGGGTVVVLSMCATGEGRHGDYAGDGRQRLGAEPRREALARPGETVVSYDLMEPDDLFRELLGASSSG
jgi:hypothetical protein